MRACVLVSTNPATDNRNLTMKSLNNCNFFLVVALQSLNLTLQTKLNDIHRELGNLQQEKHRLRQALEEKEKNLQHTKVLYESETSRALAGKHFL